MLNRKTGTDARLNLKHVRDRFISANDQSALRTDIGVEDHVYSAVITRLPAWNCG